LSRRIRITLAYDGTDFHGWQVQPGLSTIQGVLEDVVGGMEGKAVHVAGSGRTDAGVHALAQIAAFTIDNPIPTDNLRRAMNRLLPPAVRVLQAEEAHAGFHPRFDAIAKTYRYTIFRDEVCPPFKWRYVHHHPYPLNEGAMITAAEAFSGEHDFSAFAASDSRDAEGGSKVRTIFESRMERRERLLIYTVRGSGFLKHMVRNIVGTLIEAGRGNIDVGSLPEKSGATVPAKGLTLVSVEYQDTVCPEPNASL
jgi:tRNA pseudouridine38-40 synthase